MNWKELFTTYGSFVTLIIVGIGWLIQKSIELKNKRIETKYSFFQELKIKAIKKFFEAYNKAERMWHLFPTQAIIERKLEAFEIDNIVWPPMNELKASVIELHLFIDEDEVKQFEKVYDHLSKVNRVASDIYFRDKKERDSIQAGNDFAFAKDEAVKECEKLLTQIGIRFRKAIQSENI
jgi:hypothetical protein